MIERLLLALVLLRPRHVEERLSTLAARGVPTPTSWQLALGVLRMWHRVLFRTSTVGTCAAHPVRPTWRARLLAFRAARLPVLLATRAIAPLDHSGLLSSRERVIRHLLLAHHDGVQFAYDLQLLADEPGALAELAARTREVIAERTPAARFARDLVVYERYHEALLTAAERAIDGDFGVTERELADPDLTLTGLFLWCRRQPRSLGESLRARRVMEAS